jgi:hypothetical protein
MGVIETQGNPLCAFLLRTRLSEIVSSPSYSTIPSLDSVVISIGILSVRNLVLFAKERGASCLHET